MAARPTPGVYEDLPPLVADKPLRDDIAGFVGLTQRGPVDRALLVESWESFVAAFGNRADNIATPDTVLGFFVNGGRTAYVVRVLDRDKARYAQAKCQALQFIDPSLPLPSAPAVVLSVPAAKIQTAPPRARIRLPFRIPAGLKPRRGPMLPATLPLRLPPRPPGPALPPSLPPPGSVPTSPTWYAAQGGLKDPGEWANGMRCTLRFTLRKLEPRPEQLAADQLKLLPSTQNEWGRSGVELGSLLWIPESNRFASVSSVQRFIDPSLTDGSLQLPALVLQLDRTLVLRDKERVMIVEATLEVQGIAGRERYDALGLCPNHPSYLPAVLRASSRLVGLEIPAVAPILYPSSLSAVQGAPQPDDSVAVAALGALGKGPLPANGENPNAGQDGLLSVKREHFFGPDYDEEAPKTARGLSCLYPLSDVSLVLMPDLVLPGAQPVVAQISLPTGPPPCKRPTWVCGTIDPPLQLPQVPAPVVPPELVDHLDSGESMNDLIEHQQRLVRECTRLGDRMALLCPPPSATPRQAVLWRSRFNSAFAVAYYPWLHFGDAVTHPPVRLVPPIGVAAGIIARAELQFGIGHAPANFGARFTSGLARPIDDNDWAQLHAVSISVFRQLPAEVRLLGARTLSANVEYRYLHVRRLITHIKRALYARMQWVVFENNIPAVWSRLRRDVDARVLRPLFNRGAFAGDSPETSYFIRCDEVLNPRQSTDHGQLLCEIGVAPALPSEYIVFRLSAIRNEGLSIGEGV